MQKTVFSGIQPSGQMTLGNYLGAIKNFVPFQQTHNSHFCVVDLHAITVRQDPKALRENCHSIAAWYIAAGLDPEQCTLFIQSHVPAHAQLGWILGTFTQIGELERMTQFKDKSARHKTNVNGGLFTYPSLMAADILLYNTHEVPVGEDQKQHLELTRNIATRFNNIYGDIFTIPEVVMPKAAARVKDLQEPTKKMSKSDAGGGAIMLIDEAKQIEKKFKRAVTDNLAAVNWDVENQPGITNLLGIYAACKNISPDAATTHFKSHQYGALKGEIAEAVLDVIIPMQERYQALMHTPEKLDEILAIGAQKARITANETLAKVHDAMGLLPTKG